MLKRRPHLALPAVALAAPLAAVALGATTSLLTPPCSTTAPASANLPSPPPGQLNAGQILGYLVDHGGLNPNAAAGIVGNLEQESGLDPAESDGAGGGGLAQWQAGWYAQMAAYATAHGHAPDSDAGQLQYLVYNLHTAYPGLVAKLNAAPDPATAATIFETSYEKCSGVTGYMQVTPGSLCMDEDRRAYALAALHQAGTNLGAQAAAIPVALTDSDGCATTIAPSGYVDPFAHTSGLIAQRIDMGVDYDASGELDAIGAARVTFAATGIGGGWVCNTAVSGGIVYQLLGGPYNGRYIYTTEDIIPTVHAGQNVTAGQPIATFTPDGCIETGFSSQPAVEPQAIAYGQQARVGDAGANRTYCGQQMSNLLVSTGAPSGLTEGKPITGTSC